MYNVKSTAVDATARIEDLISELDVLYTEITGEPCSERFKKELRAHGSETILAIIEEKKQITHHVLMKELAEEGLY